MEKRKKTRRKKKKRKKRVATMSQTRPKKGSCPLLANTRASSVS